MIHAVLSERFFPFLFCPKFSIIRKPRILGYEFLQEWKLSSVTGGGKVADHLPRARVIALGLRPVA